MQIEMRRLSDLRPYDKNPRLNDGAVAAVAKSIQEYGFRQPIVVDPAGVIIVGHTRWKAAQGLGLQDVPVHVATDLTPEKIRAYRIADNKLNELAEWDMDILPLELAEIKSSEIDLESLGFDVPELERLLNGPVEGTAGHTDPDAIPDFSDELRTQPGDVWVLGESRLVCGDATDRSAVAKLMNGETAKLTVLDPPYGVSYVGKTADALTIDNDALNDDGLYELLFKAFKNAAEFLAPASPFYIWHAESTGLAFRRACADVGWRVRQALIWSKPAMVLGRSDYQWRHEPCLYGWTEGPRHPWFGGRSQTTVLDCFRPTASPDHPTSKPVGLIGLQIRNSSQPGDIVLDLFGGSGSTLIAAEQNGRRGYLMELSPKYCDVIVRRWEEYTGQAALKAGQVSSAIAHHSVMTSSNSAQEPR